MWTIALWSDCHVITLRFVLPINRPVPAGQGTCAATALATASQPADAAAAKDEGTPTAATSGTASLSAGALETAATATTKAAATPATVTRGGEVRVSVTDGLNDEGVIPAVEAAVGRQQHWSLEMDRVVMRLLLTAQRGGGSPSRGALQEAAGQLSGSASSGGSQSAVANRTVTADDVQRRLNTLTVQFQQRKRQQQAVKASQRDEIVKNSAFD